MRKLKPRKLVIGTETVRLLQPEALAQVDGGLGPTAFCPLRNPRVQSG